MLCRGAPGSRLWGPGIPPGQSKNGINDACRANLGAPEPAMSFPKGLAFKTWDGLPPSLTSRIPASRLKLLVFRPAQRNRRMINKQSGLERNPLLVRRVHHQVGAAKL